MTEWRERYQKRISSPQWRNMRRDLMKIRGAKCEHCGAVVKLELHHKTYERLGRELISDLEILCHRCHVEADNKRAADGRARSAAALFNAGLDTYATKKYGEDWATYGEADCIGEEYDEWLRGKGDEGW